MGTKRTVYIPEPLNTELDKFREINVSSVCQTALQAEVDRRLYRPDDVRGEIRTLARQIESLLDDSNFSAGDADADAPARRLVRRPTS